MASKIRNWQKVLLYNVPSTQYGHVLFLTVYCLFCLMMKVDLSFYTLIISCLSSLSSVAGIERIPFCSFHSTDTTTQLSQMVARPGLIGCMPLCSHASKARTQNQKCGTQWKSGPWIVLHGLDLFMCSLNIHFLKRG